jgi:hypothetical protein
MLKQCFAIVFFLAAKHKLKSVEFVLLVVSLPFMFVFPCCVIFSFGIHDCAPGGDGRPNGTIVPESDYVSNLKKIYEVLHSALAPNGTIMWVTTTPVSVFTFFFSSFHSILFTLSVATLVCF